MPRKIIFCCILTGLASCQVKETTHPFFLAASEPTQSSIILSARISATDSLEAYDIKGLPAELFFEMAKDTSGKITHFGPLITREQDDYIARHRFTDLMSGSHYYYRIRFIIRGNERGHSPWQEFTTLPGEDQAKPVSFVMVTGSNFYRFHSGFDQYGKLSGKTGDLKKGFPGYLGILSKNPDFFHRERRQCIL